MYTHAITYSELKKIISDHFVSQITLETKVKSFFTNFAIQEYAGSSLEYNIDDNMVVMSIDIKEPGEDDE